MGIKSKSRHDNVNCGSSHSNAYRDYKNQIALSNIVDNLTFARNHIEHNLNSFDKDDETSDSVNLTKSRDSSESTFSIVINNYQLEKTDSKSSYQEDIDNLYSPHDSDETVTPEANVMDDTLIAIAKVQRQIDALEKLMRNKSYDRLRKLARNSADSIATRDGYSVRDALQELQAKVEAFEVRFEELGAQWGARFSPSNCSSDKSEPKNLIAYSNQFGDAQDLSETALCNRKFASSSLHSEILFKANNGKCQLDIKDNRTLNKTTSMMNIRKQQSFCEYPFPGFT